MTQAYHKDSNSATTENSKLYLPKFCIVPLAARLEKNLSDSAKIYLGELNVLTNQYGYCWASDEQLAEMKGVSIRTIQSWHTDLESLGFIKRDTWKEHIKEEGKKGVILRTKRKIYVIEDPSNKDADPQKSAYRRDPQISACRSDPQKSAGINKEPLRKEKENNNPAEPAPSAVVVPFCLEKLEIQENLRKKIAKEYTIEAIELATERALNWKSRPSDEVAIMTALRRHDDWIDNPSQEDIEERNKEYLKTLAHLDNKHIGVVRVVIGNKYIEFVAGMKCDVFDVSDKDFKLEVKNMLERLEGLSGR